MRLRILVLPFLAIVPVVGCEEFNTQDANIPESKAPPAKVDPDNSGVNERDRPGELKTPLDQGQNTADVERTAEIRRKVLAINDISIDGQNVKIITEEGKVTLRGPVATDAEKEAIFRAAVEVAGDGNVVNELEVLPPKP